MTEKQQKCIAKIIAYFGEDTVKNYLLRFFTDVDIEHLTKKQAQKAITGLTPKMPGPIIKGVHGRG